MFERTRNFWRRLLGRPATSAGGNVAVATGEERRVWVRYPADLETSFIPADGPESTRFSARVRNISLGGINLLVLVPDKADRQGEQADQERGGDSGDERPVMTHPASRFRQQPSSILTAASGMCSRN